MPDSWKVLHRTLPEQVRENFLDVEDRIAALLGMRPMQRGGRSGTDFVGPMTTIYENISSGLLLMTDEDLERHFGIGARQRR